jgi:putative sugar O-methyltransferase
MNYEILTLIKEMMSDAENKCNLYSPGNYWKYYEKNILKQIKNNDLTKFRSWAGGAGVGNIQSFGGGENELTRYFKKNFHPFDTKFNKIDNSYLLNKYDSIINRLSYFCSFFSYFAIRSIQGRIYYLDLIKKNQETLYELIYHLDKDLLEISDSEFGNPIGFYKNDKFYTSLFLNNLKHINIIKKNTDFNNIKSVIELGSGIGMLASIFLKLNKNIKYLIIDIPPVLFFSEYYLKNIGFKVFGYKDIKNGKKISINEVFKNYQVCCIPSWELELLKNYSSDLFINIASFQEIEKEASINYINIIKNSINKYIYLDNNIFGHQKTTKKNLFGCLNPTSKLDIENELKNNFYIKYSQTINNNYKTIFEKNKNSIS